MSNILCRQCQNPITFDDKHISQKTGKKIPLDVETNERHDCPARRDQPQLQQQHNKPASELAGDDNDNDQLAKAGRQSVF